MDAERPDGSALPRPSGRPDRARLTRLLLAVALVVGLAVVGGNIGLGPSSPSGPPASLGLSLLQDRVPSARPPGASPRPGSASDPAARSSAEIGRLLADLEREPDSGDLFRDLGFAYLQRARDTGDPSTYPSAAEAFDQASKRLPGDALVLVGRGALELARHEFAGALETGSAALRLAPGLPSAQAIVVDALVELGRYEEAKVTAEALLLDDSLPAWNRTSYLRELYGDLPGALAAMEEAAVRGAGVPENLAFTFTLVGTLNAYTGRPDRAQIVYDKALEVFPEYGPALAGKARLAIAQGDLDEGVRLFERAVAILPISEYVIGLGEAQEVSGDVDAARDSYELAAFQIELFQANGVLVDVESALFAADHGEATQALEYAEASYADRQNVKTADTLAWAFYRNGRLDDAARYSGEALRLGSRDPLFLYHAGAIAAERGDAAAARTLLTDALEIDAGFSATGARHAREILDQLP